MIFIDSNYFIYAVGRPHPLREEAQRFFLESAGEGKRLITSAEELHELLHVYLPVDRVDTLDAAFELATNGTDRVLPITKEVVLYGRSLSNIHPDLSARDLIHLSICKMNQIHEIKTFDRSLRAAFDKKG